MNDIQTANQLKQSIQIQYDDVKQERERLMSLSQDLKQASEKMKQRDVQVVNVQYDMY